MHTHFSATVRTSEMYEILEEGHIEPANWSGILCIHSGYRERERAKG